MELCWPNAARQMLSLSMREAALRCKFGSKARKLLVSAGHPVKMALKTALQLETNGVVHRDAYAHSF